MGNNSMSRSREGHWLIVRLIRLTLFGYGKLPTWHPRVSVQSQMQSTVVQTLNMAAFPLLSTDTTQTVYSSSIPSLRCPLFPPLSAFRLIFDVGMWVFRLLSSLQAHSSSRHPLAKLHPLPSAPLDLPAKRPIICNVCKCHHLMLIGPCST